MSGLSSYFNKRVLVAEDSPSMQAEIISILKGIGFTNISTSNNGQEAYDELCNAARTESPYEIIFSDINMPIMNGLTLLRLTRELSTYKKTPFFIVSTENEKSTVIQAIMGGATDYILKPFQAATVLDKITKKLL